jgi:hypothetical protein
MEAQLYDFIMDERAAGRCVTGGMIPAGSIKALTRNKLSGIQWLAHTIFAPKTSFIQAYYHKWPRFAIKRR